ncbi:flavodoxin family protein [Oceaniglobus roseus]|uniref:flavodoxin family protein n=1 Tax=Oceaniglobus roseus TaxID=1737570 RepID=UPI000C7F6187|nr:flavodoxin family protein [Kandeliimicrobium roseum]
MTRYAKPLVVFYSHSGHTRDVAERFVRLSGADRRQLSPARYDIPVLWTVQAMFDAVTGAEPPLPNLGLGLAGERRWVVVAGPVWAGRLAAPLRPVLRALRPVDVPVGLLLTCGSPKGAPGAIRSAERVLDRPFAATAFVANGEPASDDTDGLNGFLARLDEARSLVLL